MLFAVNFAEFRRNCRKLFKSNHNFLKFEILQFPGILKVQRAGRQQNENDPPPPHQTQRDRYNYRWGFLSCHAGRKTHTTETSRDASSAHFLMWWEDPGVRHTFAVALNKVPPREPKKCSTRSERQRIRQNASKLVSNKLRCSHEPWTLTCMSPIP